MTRNELFSELLENLHTNKSVIDEYKYIGTGNLNANILIIGKEVAISKESEKEKYKSEILLNFDFWYKYRNKTINENDGFNPIYPYKGQILKINNKKGNWGTSRTWLTYQKLHNKIFNNEKNENINFHDDFFLTEVNSTPSRKNVDAIKDSISFRKNKIMTSSFFQNFPIVIISGVGYFKTKKENYCKNEIEEIFQVDFFKKIEIENKTKQQFWIHMNEDKTKILINTYQLSINISDDLLNKIAEVIRSSDIFKNLYPNQ